MTENRIDRTLQALKQQDLLQSDQKTERPVQ